MKQFLAIALALALLLGAAAAESLPAWELPEQVVTPVLRYVSGEEAALEAARLWCASGWLNQPVDGLTWSAEMQEDLDWLVVGQRTDGAVLAMHIAPDGTMAFYDNGLAELENLVNASVAREDVLRDEQPDLLDYVDTFLRQNLLNGSNEVEAYSINAVQHAGDCWYVNVLCAWNRPENVEEGNALSVLIQLAPEVRVIHFYPAFWDDGEGSEGHG